MKTRVVPRVGSLLAAAMLLSGQARAMTIDGDKYFAFLLLPRKGPMMETYILLSNDRCQAKGGSKGARKAVYKDAYSERHGCWDDYGGRVVTVCPATGEKGEIGNACVDVSSSRFIETSSLPRSAF